MEDILLQCCYEPQGDLWAGFVRERQGARTQPRSLPLSVLPRAFQEASAA